MHGIPAELIWQALGLLATGAAIYGGIRSDLRSMNEGIKAAHARLDNHLENHGKGK